MYKSHRSVWVPRLSSGCRRGCGWALVILLTVVGIGCAGSPYPEAQVLIGVGGIEQEDDGGLPAIFSDSDVAGQFSVGFAAPLDDFQGNGSGLRLGGRLNVTFTREDGFERDVAGEPLLTIEDFSNLTVISPMGTVSYRQNFGDEFSAFFLEPGLGVGPALGIISF
ncbi:MAG: hypothetical protein AAGK78_07535, partial [Planctomycetota bacterium]